MRRDQFTSLFLILFAIYYCITSFRLGMGNVHNPGPGFIPFLAGILLGCLSLAIFIQSAWSKKGREEKEASPPSPHWKRALWVLGSLFIYNLLLERLGFLITSFLFMLVILGSFRPRRLTGILLISVLTVVISYLVFNLWLKVQLPKGMFGI